MILTEMRGIEKIHKYYDVTHPLLLGTVDQDLCGQWIGGCETIKHVNAVNNMCQLS